jgi:phosphoribosyl-AMP cyclohydrolase
VKSLRLDCDEDVVLMEVEQEGGMACHTGRESCFYRRLENGQWVEVDAVIKEPREIYRSE